MIVANTGFPCRSCGFLRERRIRTHVRACCLMFSCHLYVTALGNQSVLMLFVIKIAEWNDVRSTGDDCADAACYVFAGAHASEPQRTSATLSEPQRTSANLGEPSRTRANHSEPWRTSVNLGEPWRTPVNCSETLRTLAHIFDSLRSGPTSAKF